MPSSLWMFPPRYDGVRMNENELFQVALGLMPPWMVDHCTFDQTAGRLDIHLDFPRGSVFACPVCRAGGCKAYDTDTLTWRRLNFFQHQTFLHARTPRVDCPQCGVHRVAVPWARPDSGFTLLFEALVLMLAKSMPILAVARFVGEHDTLIWRTVTHYVDAARAKTDHSTVTQVGVDETASRRGQTYVSLFVDLERRRVLFATPGKDASTVAAFATDLKAHGGNPKTVTDVSADMSQAFFKGVTANLPNAAVTFDKFHVVSLVGAAVEKVRRLEQKTSPELAGSRYVWLKNPENLTERQWGKFDELDIVNSHLKTARAYQIRLAFQELYTSPQAKPNPTSSDGTSGPPTAAFNPSLMQPKPFANIRPASSAGSPPASTTESSKASTASSRPPRPKPAATAQTATSPPSSTSLLENCICQP
jgi:transposase